LGLLLRKGDGSDRSPSRIKGFMYYGSIPHDRIIDAFCRNVPGAYVRDYRDSGGYITICRGYKDLPWKDQISTRKVYKQVPSETLCSLPRGNVTSATKFAQLRLVRPGWRMEFRKAMKHLSDTQMRNITKSLNVGEVFPGIV
jgi:hypothetical protein